MDAARDGDDSRGESGGAGGEDEREDGADEEEVAEMISCEA